MIENVNSSSSLKTKTVTNFFWRLAERTLAQLVGALVSIVLARILLPQDYGVVAIVLLFTSLLDVFVSEGFATALIQKKDADDNDFSSMFYASLFISSIIYLIVFVSAPYIAMYFGSEYSMLCPLLRVLSLQIPLGSFKSIQEAFVSRNLQFKKFFFATLGGTIASAVIGISLALYGVGPWALVAQYLSNSVIDTFILNRIVRWYPKAHFSMGRVLPMLNYSYKLVLVGLVGRAYNELRSFVIGKRYTPADLGYYNRGNQFPSLFLNNIESSLISVLFPVMSSLQDNRENVINVCRRAVKISTYVLFPIMTILALIMEDLIYILLTDKWLPAVPYGIIFCCVYAFYPIYTTNIQAIRALGKSTSFFWYEMAKKVNGIICIIIAVPFGVYAIALSLLAATFVNYFINSISASRVIGYTHKLQILDLLPNLVMTIIMYGAVSLVPQISGSRIVDMIIRIVFATSIYLTLSYLSRNESFLELKSMALSLVNKRKNHANSK